VGALLHVGADADVAGHAFVADLVRRRLDLDAGDVAHLRLDAAGRVDRQVTDGLQVVPGLGRAPDLDVVGLAIPEDVPDLLAGDQGRRRTADVARLEAVLLSDRQVLLDEDLWHVHLLLLAHLRHTRSGLEHLLDLVGLGAQHAQVRTVDPHDHGLAGPGQYLLDALLEVGGDIPLQPRIAVDNLLDGGNRLVVVGVRIDRDPVLTGVHAHDLIGEERLADVGAEVPYARDRPELLAAPGHD